MVNRKQNIKLHYSNAVKAHPAKAVTKIKCNKSIRICIKEKVESDAVILLRALLSGEGFISHCGWIREKKLKNECRDDGIGAFDRGRHSKDF